MHDLGQTAIPFWLSDSTLVTINLSESIVVAITTFALLKVAGFSRFEPATGSSTALDWPAEALSSLFDYNGLALLVETAGWKLANPVDLTGYSVELPNGEGRLSIVQPLENLTWQPVPCNRWVIEKLAAGERSLIYEAENTLWLTDLTALADGSVLFLEWAAEDCQITNTMTLTLKRLFADGQATIVVQGISPIEDGRNNLNIIAYNQGHRYSVSPDGRYVVWPSSSLDAGFSALNLTEIETGATAVLMKARAGSGSDDFLDNQMFQTVFWVNP